NEPTQLEVQNDEEVEDICSLLPHLSPKPPPRRSIRATSSHSTAEAAEPPANDALLSSYFLEVENQKLKFGRQKKYVVNWKSVESFAGHSHDHTRDGTRDCLGDVKTPMEYFLEYIPDSMFEQAAFHTNLYANRKGITRFSSTDSAEIAKLIALHILMGTLKFPRIRMYWDKTFKVNVFTENMPRNLFFQLRTHLHIVDSEKIDPGIDPGGL
ncbi:unnamed protein product, partial [Nesidiocoris tenuis]